MTKFQAICSALEEAKKARMEHDNACANATIQLFDAFREYSGWPTDCIHFAPVDEAQPEWSQCPLYQMRPKSGVVSVLVKLFTIGDYYFIKRFEITKVDRQFVVTFFGVSHTLREDLDGKSGFFDEVIRSMRESV
jgi:hypothetical protein